MSETSQRTAGQYPEREQPIESAGGQSMTAKGIETALCSINEFFDSARDVGKNRDLAAAKMACEKSREAWLNLFPYRRDFLSRYRDVVGDFVQALADVTERTVALQHQGEGRLSEDDAADLQHYTENMKDRMQLLTSLLVGEDRVKKRLMENTRQLARR